MPDFPRGKLEKHRFGGNLPGIEAIVVDVGDERRFAAGRGGSHGGLHIMGVDQVRPNLPDGSADFPGGYRGNGEKDHIPRLQCFPDGPLRGGIDHIDFSPEHLHNLADHILGSAEKHIA